jgi:Domain of unknown function (DUF3883)
MALTTSERSSNPMNAARPADGLLSAGQTMALLEILSQAATGVTEERAARDMGVQRAASHTRTYNSIAMLEAVGLVVRDKERVRSNVSSPIDWRSRIAAWVAQQIAERMARDGAHALQLHAGGIVLDPMQLPGPIDGLRLWLIEFGVASRTGSSSRHWFVENEFEGFFLDAARRWNVSTRRRISQEALEARLENQGSNGAAAEEWLLQRERVRLAGHPLVEQVMRVSIEDAGAGFDIISFSTPSAIVHDHFVEVKSFSGGRRFFWTRNEIETARRLGEAYHLCIVDRDRMEHPDYSPEVISGPYAALIETGDNGWSISPTTFECIALDG